jgi:hypothetical protein
MKDFFDLLAGLLVMWLLLYSVYSIASWLVMRYGVCATGC